MLSHEELIARILEGLKLALDDHGLHEPLVVTVYSAEGHGFVGRFGGGTWQPLISTTPPEAGVWSFPVTCLYMDPTTNRAFQRIIQDPALRPVN